MSRQLAFCYYKYAGFALTIGLTIAMVSISINMGAGTGKILENFSLLWLLVLISEVLSAVMVVVSLVTDLNFHSTLAQFTIRKGKLYYLRYFALPAGVLLLFGFGWLAYYFQPDRFQSPISLVWLIWFGSFYSAVIMQGYYDNVDFFVLHVIMFLVAGNIFLVFNHFQEVTDYPFSISWSEGSRFFNASLFFSKIVYGRDAPFPVLHPSRYLLQSLPFLLPSPSLWLLRFWQFLLWSTIPLIFSWLVVRCLQIKQKSARLFFLFLIPLVLNIGPVYYHLIVCTLPVLAFYRKKRNVIILLLVACGSIWAGISRINWWPIPGSIAALLFLYEDDGRLEINDNSFLSVTKYYFWPALYILFGTITSFFTSTIYEVVSKNPRYVFNSSFESPLLWYRLFPNATSQLGIFIQAVLFLSPYVVLISWALLKFIPSKNYQRILLFSLFVVFFFGGIIVSLKIGGGSNIHNFDALIVLLTIAYCYTLKERWASLAISSFALHALIGLTVVLPMLAVATSFIHYEYPPQSLTSQTIQKLQTSIDQYSNGKKILFLSEIQLTTFKTLHVEQVELSYERVFLQEMAMSDNKKFFEEFNNKVANKEYPVIISDRLTKVIKGPSQAFWEENNAWVTHVSRIVLEHYFLSDCYQLDSICVYLPK